MPIFEEILEKYQILRLQLYVKKCSRTKKSNNVGISIKFGFFELEFCENFLILRDLVRFWVYKVF